jgi:flagellar protein FliO/FliZ
VTPSAAYLVETLVTLLAVVVVAVLVLVGARRLGVGGAQGPIELVGRLPLDARRAVYLVKVGRQVLVLGASEAGLTRLGEVASHEIGEIKAPRGFLEVLRDPSRTPPPRPGGPSAPSVATAQETSEETSA